MFELTQKEIDEIQFLVSVRMETIQEIIDTKLERGTYYPEQLIFLKLIHDKLGEN